jgi:LPXTG-motif cell wall-anchored protein
MAIRRLPACFAGIAVLVGGFLSLGGTAAATPSLTAASTAWLLTQQQTDGGFETQGFPGFETPDAIFALAAQAQTGSSWSTSTALSTILATKTAGGKMPLDAIDAWAQSGLSKGQAAKVIALVAEPLGLDPTDFDWACNGGAGTNLTTLLGSPASDGSYGPASAFSSTLYGAIADDDLTGAVAPTTVAFIKAAQKSDGSWSYDGLNTGTGGDIDTTALTLNALHAAGLGAGDAAYDAGVAYLSSTQQSDGAWESFGAKDPNSTATALLGLTPDAGTADLAKARTWLESQVAGNGHITSPNDGFGVSTFATSQGIEALQLSTAGVAGWPADEALTSKASTFCASKVTTTTTTAAVTTTTAGSGVLGTNAEDGTTAVGTLPRTGSSMTEPLTIFGAAFVVLGAFLVRARRRSVRRPS